MKQLVILLMIFSYSLSFSQDDKWMNFNSSENIFALLSKNDDVWVATGGGLIRVNINDNSIVRYNRGNSLLPSNNVTSLAKDSTGNFWVGTDNGIVRISGEEWTLYDQNNSDIPDNVINCIAAAANGDIFLGTGYAGLAKFSNSEFTSIELPHGDCIINNILSLTIDKNQTVWLSGSGSRKGNQCTGQFKYSHGYAEYFPTYYKKMKCDNMGNLYAFDVGAIYKLNSDTLKLFYDFPFDFDINDIFFDNSNNLYIGFDNHGLMIYNIDSEETKYFMQYLDFPVKVSSHFTEDENNNIWVGTRIGLYKYDGIKFENIYLSNSTQRASIRLRPQYYTSDNLYIDKDNTYHLIMRYQYSNGVNYTGISSFDGKKWAFSDIFEKRFLILSYSLDSDSTFWGGNGNKLFRYEKGGWTLFDSTSGFLNAGNFIDIEKDIDGNVWVIKEKDQLLRFDSESWIEMNSNNSILPMRGFESINKDRSGNLWISTAGYVYIFDDGEWHTIKKENTSFYGNNSLYRIIFENDSTFWISNRNGLSKYENFALSEEILSGGSRIGNESFVKEIYKIGDDEYWLQIVDFVYIGTNKDGPMFTTSHHIHHWKGEEYTKYEFGDKDEMIMCIDSNNNPVVAHNNSVYIFNDSTWIKMNHENSRLAKSYLKDMQFDKYNNLLVSFGNDLFIYNENGIRSIDANPLLPPQPPFNLKLEQDSLNIKLSWDYNSSENVSYNIYKKEANDTYFHLIAENISERSFEDTVDYETTYHYSVKSESTETGLVSIYSNIVKCQYVWEPEKKWRQFNTYTSFILNDLIYSVAIDSTGNLWYGTDQIGYGMYDGKSWDHKYFMNDIYAIEVTKDNIVWVSSIPISYVKNGVIEHIDLPNFEQYYNDLAFDSNYDLWLVNNDSVYSYSPENNFSESFSKPHGSAIFVCVDKTNKKWIALAGYGIASMNNDNTWELYNAGNSNLPDNVLWGLTIDSQDNVWISTNAGLAKFDGSDFYNYGSSGSRITVDRNDNIWGYFNNTIAKFDGKDWKYYYDFTDGMPSLNVTDICIDKYDNKWFANYNGGIVVFNENGINVKATTSSIDNNVTPLYSSKNELIALYPNPAEDFVVVSLSPEKTYSIVVYDILGNIIYSVDKLTEKNEHMIDLDQWSNNVYIIKVISGNHVFGKVFIKK
jgi:ligand-binding sensor domain-containing protein